MAQVATAAPSMTHVSIKPKCDPNAGDWKVTMVSLSAMYSRAVERRLEVQPYVDQLNELLGIGDALSRLLLRGDLVAQIDSSGEHIIFELSDTDLMLLPKSALPIQH
jgi:hypothetical protein